MHVSFVRRDLQTDSKLCADVLSISVPFRWNLCVVIVYTWVHLTPIKLNVKLIRLLPHAISRSHANQGTMHVLEFAVKSAMLDACNEHLTMLLTFDRCTLFHIVGSFLVSHSGTASMEVW